MKTAILLRTLPVFGLTLVLTACGGGDDDPVDPGQTASITACFTVPNTVSFAMASSGVPSGSVGINRSTVGPTTYNGQAVTKQTFFFPTGGTPKTSIFYWATTSSGVTFIANVNINGAVTPGSMSLPKDMSPNQTVTDADNYRYTFIGFQTLNLAGKTFSNTCHIKMTDPSGSMEDSWYAPGYGLIKDIYTDGGVTQYNGDL